MQFVHSSLATRGRVDNCVVLETRKNSVDVLAFSGDCVQRMTIVRNVKKDPLLYKVHQKFLIETPIRFAAMAQGRLVTVSEANVVALSECSVSLKRVAEVDLSEALADFNGDMTTAYRVTGTLQTPVGMEGCNAEITGWETVEGGDVDAKM